MNDYHLNKKLVGPGGIKCPCCTKTSVKDTRKMVNRQFRRADKKALKSFDSAE